jgi:hypothetical protein
MREQAAGGRGGIGIGLALAAVMAALPARAELRVSAGTPIAIAVDDGALNRQPQSACDAAGSCVVAWDRFSFSTPQVGIVARRYDALGNPRGGVFAASTQPSDLQQSPLVAMLPTGEFVIAWEVTDQNGVTTAIFFRHFRANGSPLGMEIEASSPVGGMAGASVAIDGSGRVVVAWWNLSGVYLRRFARNGRPLTPPLLVEAADAAAVPALAMRADGSFILVWRTFQTSSGAGIWAQRFAASGAPLGDQVQVHSKAIPDLGTPEVAALPGGGFEVVWDSCDFAHLDLGCVVRIRRFTANGKARSPELEVSPPDFRVHWRPVVAADAHGDVAVAWDDCLVDNAVDRQPFDCKVAARFFDALGNPGREVWTITSDDDLGDPAVAAGSGGFLVGYDSTRCDVRGCLGRSPTGAYAVRFAIQP